MVVVGSKQRECICHVEDYVIQHPKKQNDDDEDDRDIINDGIIYVWVSTTLQCYMLKPAYR